MGAIDVEKSGTPSKEIAMKNLNKQDFDKWTELKSNLRSVVNKHEIEMIAKLNAKYVDHNLDIPKPGGCPNDRARRVVQKDISELNTLYDTGIQV